MKFATGVTMTSAGTDLLVGLVLIPLSMLISRIEAKDEREKQLWMNVFRSLSVVCILGFVVHGIVWSERLYGMIWVVLYAAMFMAVHQFLFVGVHKNYGENGMSEKLRTAIDAVSLGMYVLMAVLSLLHINPIRIFTVYGILMIVPGFFLFARKEHKTGLAGERFLLIAFLPQIIGALLILFRVPEFKFIVQMDHNCIYHLCLLFSVFIIYFAAKRSLSEKNDEMTNEDEEINEKEETFI